VGKKTNFFSSSFLQEWDKFNPEREREGYSINEFCYHLIMLETGSPVKNLFTSGYTRITKRLYLHKAKTKHMHACAQTRSRTHTHTHTHRETDALKQISSMEANVTCSSKK